MKDCGDTEIARELNLEELGSIPRYGTTQSQTDMRLPLRRISNI
jgi:hypothetical protein